MSIIYLIAIFLSFTIYYLLFIETTIIKNTAI